MRPCLKPAQPNMFGNGLSFLAVNVVVVVLVSSVVVVVIKNLYQLTVSVKKNAINSE